ncbi:hypothetical protein OSB04_005658 [Centaurea solstitialis]|uniref:Wall-associated receptor kinase galacturonan-binding domain-containing protein n=1 Tax=Centaurea solstitialis TaxID=347529 RepID=A0AA38U148_9ASTR|nr:hypothetical protein OSB04_005658 [Centaurea solstitialis]
MKFSRPLLLLQILLVGFVNSVQTKRDNCAHKCGNVDIHYPFGTTEDCSLDYSYHIECNYITQVPYLRTDYYLGGLKVLPYYIEVLEIKLDGHLRVAFPVAYSCFDKQGTVISSSEPALNTSRFPFSSTQNRFIGLQGRI